MFDQGPINYLVFVNHPGIPEIPESIELFGCRERIELCSDVVEDIQKGEVLIVRGRKQDLDHWLSGVTLYVADDHSLVNWTKYTLPVRVKH